jgi:hypothetical protein
LREQSPVNERRRKIADRLALDEHRVVDQVVPGREVSHPDVERAGSTQGIQQGRAALAVIDSELMDGFSDACVDP